MSAASLLLVAAPAALLFLFGSKKKEPKRMLFELSISPHGGREISDHLYGVMVDQLNRIGHVESWELGSILKVRVVVSDRAKLDELVKMFAQEYGATTRFFETNLKR